MSRWPCEILVRPSILPGTHWLPGVPGVDGSAEGVGAGALGSAEAVGTAGTVGTSLGDTDGTLLGSAEGASVGATVGSVEGAGSTGAGFDVSPMGALSGASAPCAVYLVPGS